MMNKEEMADEVKRLKNILEEKKSNTQNIFYLDDIFETIKGHLEKLPSFSNEFNHAKIPA